MRTFALLILASLLAACSSAPEGAVSFTYDPEVWEYFSNNVGSGLNIKSDESCWIDLSGDLTKPEGVPFPYLENGITYHYTTDTELWPPYISFEVNGETLNFRVSVENEESCILSIKDVASANGVK